MALALDDIGFQVLGVRLDSGDLSYLSRACWSVFHDIAERFNRPFMKDLTIAASNDINEEFLTNLDESHRITTFGIGTHLVTCQRQPALGCVFKLVDINGIPRIKLSEELEKILIPGRKWIYRLYGEGDVPLVDLISRASDGKFIFCVPSYHLTV